MSKKNVLTRGTIVCLISLFSGSLFAQGLSQAPAKQQGLNRGLEALYRVLEDNTKRNTNHDSYESIEGSAYFDESFKKGVVYYDNSYMGTPFLRYDAYADEIQIKNSLLEEEKYGALLKSEKLYCIIDSKKVLYHSLRDSNGEVSKGYVMNLVNSGKYLLFEKKSKNFLEGKIAPTSLTMPTNSKFIEEVNYYFGIKGGETVTEIYGNRNDLVSMFDEKHQDKIKSFVKKNRINMDDRSDLQKLFYYANTL